MKIKDELPLQVKFLQEYFEREGELTIIGLHDNVGFNIHKNFLKQLKEVLDTKTYSIEVVDAFTMLFNKMNHLDSFLKHNISLEELHLIQKYGCESEITTMTGSKIIGSIFPHLNQSFMKQIRNPEKFKVQRLASVIQNAINPVVIYSSGVSDMITELHMNPFDLKKAYLERNKTSKYDYALSKATPETVKKMMDGHRQNFENLLGLNEHADCYALNTFLCSDMNHDYEEKFKEMILLYNDRFKRLCKEYNVSYVNLRVLENTIYRHPALYYISEKPHEIITKQIIQEMYQKINSPVLLGNVKKSNITFDSSGIYGVMRDIRDHYIREFIEIGSNYEGLVHSDKVFEHEREFHVLQKVKRHLSR